MKKCYLLIALFALVLVGPIAASTKAVSFSVVANATQTEMDYLRQITVLESTNALEKKYYETWAGCLPGNTAIIAAPSIGSEIG